jgi:hypothetical protein
MSSKEFLYESRNTSASAWHFLVLQVFACLLSVNVSAQVFVTGQIIDEVTRKPLANTSIAITEINMQTISDNDGKFSLWCDKCSFHNLHLSISYIGYDAKTIGINPGYSNGIIIGLTPSGATLGEIDITPGLMPYLFFGSKETQVLDYEFYHDGWLIALYNFHRKKTFFVYLGNSKEILFEREFTNTHFQHFFVSCINRYYADAGNEVHELFIDNKGIRDTLINVNYFNYAIKYYVGNKGKYFFITRFFTHNLVQAFYLEDTEIRKISQKPFAWVERERDIKRLKNSEYHIQVDKLFLNRDVNHNGGSDMPTTKTGGSLQQQLKENDIERIEYTEREAYQEYMFKEIFAPLYVMDSALIIMNYYNNTIERYRFNGEWIDSIRLKVANEKGQIKQTYYDATDNKVYYRNENADTTQSIYELTIATGEGRERKKILRKDSYTIKVFDGNVYYPYNPPHTNNVILFREKMD